MRLPVTDYTLRLYLLTAGCTSGGKQRQGGCTGSIDGGESAARGDCRGMQQDLLCIVGP